MPKSCIEGLIVCRKKARIEICEQNHKGGQGSKGATLQGKKTLPLDSSPHVNSSHIKEVIETAEASVKCVMNTHALTIFSIRTFCSGLE